MQNKILFLFGLLMTWSLTSHAQECSLASFLSEGAEVSVMGLVTGDYPHLGEAQRTEALDAIQNPAPSPEKAFQAEVLLRLSGMPFSQNGALPMDSLMTDTIYHAEIPFYSGLLELLDGKYQEASFKFSDAELRGQGAPGCSPSRFRTTAQYLEQYGDQSPLFTGFNGGFYNFCRDSLGWGRKGPGNAVLESMIGSMRDLYLLSGGQGIYLELMADLITHVEDPILSNWMSCLLYYRLSKDLGNPALKEKAFYALEAPRTRRDRFDNYRFVQLGKKLDEDMALAAGSTPSSPLSEHYGKAGTGLNWMREAEAGSLPGVVKKAAQRLAEKEGMESKFAGEVDLKVVKSDKTFNFYALIVIFMVLASFIVLFRKVRKSKRHQEEQQLPS